MRGRRWSIVAAGVVSRGARAAGGGERRLRASRPIPPDATFDAARAGLQRHLRRLDAGLLRADPVRRPRRDDRDPGPLLLRPAPADRRPRQHARHRRLRAAEGRRHRLRPGRTARLERQRGQGPGDLGQRLLAARPPTRTDRKAFVHPYTTRAYQPGPIPAGSWAVELGLASIIGPPTDPDGIDWRVRVETSTARSGQRRRTRARHMTRRPAAAGFGWYCGRRPRPRRAGARQLADAAPRSTSPSRRSARAAPGSTSSGSSTTTTTSTRARSAATSPTTRAS